MTQVKNPQTYSTDTPRSDSKAASSDDQGLRRALLLGVTGFAVGTATGAGVMYLLDPDRGRRRRALAKDQLSHATHEVKAGLRATAADVRNRSKGLAHEVGRRVGATEDVDDATLKARVRSAIGHAIDHSHSVVVSCDDGKVSVAGPVLASEAKGLLSKIKKVPGVRSVRDLLARHETAEGVPALQARADAGDSSDAETADAVH